MKAGNEILRFDTARHPPGDAAMRSCLIHEDGFMRVPVLVLGDLVVRGYTEALYAEAFTASAQDS